VTAATVWLALNWPRASLLLTSRWSLRWYGIAAVLLLPVVVVIVAERRLRELA